MAEYDKLKGSLEVDWDAVRQYAQGKKELAKLHREYERLRVLLSNNDNLAEYTWKTKLGEVIPIKDIEDDHLKNIVRMLERHEGVYVPPALAEEYESRGFGFIDVSGGYDYSEPADGGF